MRRVASFVTVTRLPSRSTRRWREIAGRDTSKFAAISPAVRSRCARSSTILTRVSSARASHTIIAGNVTDMLRNVKVTKMVIARTLPHADNLDVATNDELVAEALQARKESRHVEFVARRP